MVRALLVVVVACVVGADIVRCGAVLQRALGAGFLSLVVALLVRSARYPAWRRVLDGIRGVADCPGVCVCVCGGGAPLSPAESLID